MTPGEVLNAVLVREDIDQVRYIYRRRDRTRESLDTGVHQFTVERRAGDERQCQSFCITGEFLAHVPPEAGQRVLARQIANLLSEETT